ncbi:MAG: hypothetical protein JNM51_10145, partial [Bacteroidia bacterium]|nr:hypothetical protein [Bacteroidia bacterium]
MIYSSKHSVLIICFLTISIGKIRSQTNKIEPVCKHIVRKSNPSKIIKYLQAKYGIEKTEVILLNLKEFEEQYQVRVLFDSEYFAVKAELENGLLLTTDLK